MKVIVCLILLTAVVIEAGPVSDGSGPRPVKDGEHRRARPHSSARRIRRRVAKASRPKVKPTIISRKHFIPKSKIVTVPRGEGRSHPTPPFPGLSSNGRVLKAGASVPTSVACANLNGVCKARSSCSGSVVTGKCSGDATIICCIGTSTQPSPQPSVPNPNSNGLPKCSAFKSGAYAGTSALLNTKAATKWTLIPAVSYASEGSSNPYRVARDSFGNMPETDSRLVAVATPAGYAGQKLHKVCAARFNALAAAAKAAGIGVLSVASGWRPHLWHNDYNYYCAQMKKQYPNLTCAQAGANRAFKSPHETGLAFDLGSPSPFTPSFSQKCSTLFKSIRVD